MKLKNLELKKNRLIYFLILATGILVSGLFREYYGLIFLITVLLLPLFSFLIPWILLKFAKLEIESQLENTIPDESNQISIVLNSPLFKKLEIEYFISQKFSRYHEHETIQLGEDDSLELKLPHCGKVDFRLHQLKTYDLLHLVHLKRKIEQSHSFYIFPPIVPVVAYVESIQRKQILEKGDDLTELYELRNYQQSDPMKAIHWKLSNKKGTLITKVGTKSDGLGIILFLKLTNSPSKNDETLSLFHSFVLELLKEYTFSIAYIEDHEIKVVEIYSKDQYLKEFQHILSLPLESGDGYDLYGGRIYTFEEGGIQYDQ